MTAPTEVEVGTGIGSPVDRKEDKKLLQGQAQWVDNMHAHGMVYLGVSGPAGFGLVRRLDLDGDRAAIRRAAVSGALDLLGRALVGNGS